jgi:hypothetical protein
VSLHSLYSRLSQPPHRKTSHLTYKRHTHQCTRASPSKNEPPYLKMTYTSMYARLPIEKRATSPKNDIHIDVRAPPELAHSYAMDIWMSALCRYCSNTMAVPAACLLTIKFECTYYLYCSSTMAVPAACLLTKKCECTSYEQLKRFL